MITSKRVRVFFPLILALGIGCSESTYEPGVEVLFDRQMDLGGGFESPWFYPFDADIGPDGLLYFLTPSTHGSRTIATYTVSGDPAGRWPEGSFPYAADRIAVHPNGNVMVVEWSFKIGFYKPDGARITGWGDNHSGEAYADITADAGGFVYILGSIRPAGHVLSKPKIFKHDAGGTRIDTWDLEGGTRISVSPTGNILVSLGYRNAVLEFTPNGTLVAKHQFSVSFRDVAGVSDQEMLLALSEGLIGRSVDGVIVETWGTGDHGKDMIEVSILLLDGSGNLHAVDPDARRVNAYSRRGERIARWRDPAPSTANFEYLKSVFVDNRGSVHGLDQDLSRVVRFSAEGDFESSWGTPGLQPGMWWRGLGVLSDSHGAVFVLDWERIHRFSASGDYELSWSAGLQNLDFAIDRFDHIYVTGIGVSGVVKFDRDGHELDQWNVTTSHASLIAIDVRDRVHLVDGGDGRVRVFTIDGKPVRDWKLYGTDEVWNFTDLAVDSRGRSYVVEEYRRFVVHVFGPDGQNLATMVGLPRAPYDNPRDGFVPTSIHIDRNDGIWLANRATNEIELYSLRPDALE